MDYTALINLALQAVAQLVTLIASIKAQGGLTDDQILAEAQKVTAGNDAAYAALKAALTTTTVS